MPCAVGSKCPSVEAGLVWLAGAAMITLPQPRPARPSIVSNAADGHVENVL